MNGDWLDAGDNIRCPHCDAVSYIGDEDPRDCKACGQPLDLELEGNPHARACLNGGHHGHEGST